MGDMILNIMGAQNPDPPQTRNAWRDIVCAPFNGSAPGTTADAEMRIDNCYGVGFTGTLPPGACLAVARGDDRAALSAWRDLVLTGAGGRPWAMYNWTAINSSYPSDANRFPPNVSILRPGDVMMWGGPDTVSCWAFNPFLYEPGYVGVAEDSFTTFEPYVILPRGVVRAFQRPDIVIPPSLGYTRVPWTFEALYGGVSPSAVTDGYRVFGTHLTIHWKGNATNLTRISTSKSFEVWWLLTSGVWAHNDADDFDAAGRGVVTSSHDAETYEIPQAAQRVFIADSLATGATETPMLILEDRNPR